MSFQMEHFCGQISPFLQLVGQTLLMLKVVLPLVLIVIAVFDIFKAIISSKSDDVKKSLKNILKKVFFCILIFFIPAIIIMIFSFVSEFRAIKEDSGIDFDVCYDCIFNPYSETCVDALDYFSISE